MKKLRNLLLVLTLLLIGSVLLPANAQAASPSKKKLTANIKKASSQVICETYYDDFDMDGNKELFAITSDDDGYQYQLWFASKAQTCCAADDLGSTYWVNDNQGIVTISKSQKLFLVEYTYGGSASFTNVCYVAKNKVYNVKKTGCGIGQLSGKNFEVYSNDYDGIIEDGLSVGHTCKRYYIYWTGKAFKEYTGKSITQTTFKKYSGGSTILSKIKKAGYKIGKIYKRSNGIININCSRKDGSTTYNDNVTCTLKKNKVKVVICDKNGSNIVEQSTYGGVYQAKGF